MFEKLTIEAVVNKPLAHVWTCWALPEHIVNWNFASEDWHCPHAENDLRTGGRFLFRMEAKDGAYGFDFEGVYDEVLPERKIQYTMPDGRAVVTHFEALHAATKVTTVFDAETVNDLNLQQEGWQSILNQSKKYAESLV